MNFYKCSSRKLRWKWKTMEFWRSKQGQITPQDREGQKKEKKHGKWVFVCQNILILQQILTFPLQRKTPMASRDKAFLITILWLEKVSFMSLINRDYINIGRSLFFITFFIIKIKFEKKKKKKKRACSSTLIMCWWILWTFKRFKTIILSILSIVPIDSLF